MTTLLIEHFYADQTAKHGDYLYRVAPRDALAQVRQWPEHMTQFSTAVPVTTYDFLPPLPPPNPQAVVNASNHGRILLFVAYNDVWWTEYKVTYEALQALGYEVDVVSSGTGEAYTYGGPSD